ncbi:MAG: hypothetical protein QMB59_00825 [Bacteroidales bacterium]
MVRPREAEDDMVRICKAEDDMVRLCEAEDDMIRICEPQDDMIRLRDCSDFCEIDSSLVAVMNCFFRKAGELARY